MSIEEIKKRLENYNRVPKNFEYAKQQKEFLKSVPDDIIYLLSIIEQAEKALDKSIVQMRSDYEEIANEAGFPADDDSQIINEAVEVLKVIRG